MRDSNFVWVWGRATLRRSAIYQVSGLWTRVELARRPASLPAGLLRVTHDDGVTLQYNGAGWHTQIFLLDKSRHPFHFIYGEWRREEAGRAGPNGEEGAD